MNKYITIILLALLATLSACTDDDSFSASTANTLTFSADTVTLRHALLTRANGHTHLLGVQPLGRRHTLLKRTTGEWQPDGIPRQRRRHLSRQRTGISNQRDRDSRQGLNTRLRRADIAGEPRQDSTAVGGQYRLHARKRCSAEA